MNIVIVVTAEVENVLKMLQHLRSGSNLYKAGNN